MLSPQPGGTIEIEGRRYRFTAHPSAPRNVYALEASRATVYQVISDDGMSYALKVFKLKFRVASLVETTARLRPLRLLPGLLAAERSIIIVPPEDIPDLRYALLIPWVRGTTWSDLLTKAKGGATLEFDHAVRLCDRFLLVVEMLQSHTIAHTDLSAANVVLDVSTLDVQLVDLEDIYTATADEPAVPSRGSRGYQHPHGETCWHSAGDRYSSTVLAAEILLSVDRQAMALATEEFCFGPNSTTPEQVARIAILIERLRLLSGTFSSVFERALYSTRMADCPSATELRQAIRPLKMQLDAGIRWVPREEQSLPLPPSPFFRPARLQPSPLKVAPLQNSISATSSRPAQASQPALATRKRRRLPTVAIAATILALLLILLFLAVRAWIRTSAASHIDSLHSYGSALETAQSLLRAS